MPLRVVADTNFFVRALVGNGIPAAIYASVDQSMVMLVTSVPMLAELRRILSQPEFDGQLRSHGMTPESAVALVAAACELVEPDRQFDLAIRDENDRIVLQTAVGGNADLIVTGDNDLLVLSGIQNIAIVRPSDLLHTLGLQHE